MRLKNTNITRTTFKIQDVEVITTQRVFDKLNRMLTAGWTLVEAIDILVAHGYNITTDLV